MSSQSYAETSGIRYFELASHIFNREGCDEKCGTFTEYTLTLF